MTSNFIIRKDTTNKKGLHPIRLRITQHRKIAYFSLKIFADIDFWDEESERFIIKKSLRKAEEKEANEDRKKNNALIERICQKVNKIEYFFSENNIDFTLNQFKEKYSNQAKQSNIHSYFERHIATLIETKHIGNANTFSITLKMLTNFDENFNKKLFSEIDIKYIKKFDVWMQVRECKGNTRMHYLKKLRAIWNMAIKDGEAASSSYPFGKLGFEVGLLEEETEKRYLPTEYLEILKTTKSKTPNGEFARNVFLLSYYLYGMSFRDMGLLKKANIVKLNKGKYIVYKRTKTRNIKNTKAISIRMTSDIVNIINALCENSLAIDDYLLPLISLRKDNETDHYKHLSNRRKTIGGWMKDLSEEFNFDFNLTTYVSRHTMAMQLQDNEIPESVISQILGHKDLRTTKTYLDSLDTSIIDEAAQVL